MMMTKMTTTNMTQTQLLQLPPTRTRQRYEPDGPMYTVSGKIVYSILGITSSDAGGFSKKIFTFRISWKCAIKRSLNISSYLKCITTLPLWNVDVRKLVACPMSCGSLAERWTRQNPDVLQAAATFFKWNLFIYASAPLGGANAYMFYRWFFCFFFFLLFAFSFRHNDSA